jgi:hypothetical protein
MRTIANVTAAIAMMIGTVSSTFAASGAREDNSGVFAWIFLGFCAMIVVGQLLPAVMVMLGFAKGVKREATHEEAAH